MRLITYPTADGFLAAAEPALMEEEAKNSLILGIAQQVAKGRSYGEEPAWFLTVHDDGALIAAAICTPPYNVILHCDEDRLDALDRVADYLVDVGERLPGAHGTVSVVGAFADAWGRRTGAATRIQMSQRVYCLTEVTTPTGVSGRMRWAERDDVGFLAEWIQGFQREAVPGDPVSDPGVVVARLMDAGMFAIWEDGEPVSMAASSRGSKNGAAVSAVYTPPERRGHGYASACVAGLSRAMLDAGSTFCTLYTDLSNPTSNKVYQNVGYRPVADFAMYTFDPKEE